MNYRYPLKSWMVDIFKEREINRNKLNTKFPFVIMSSAAKIVKSDPKATKKEILNQVAEILKNPNSAQYTPIYKGCIITNHIEQKSSDSIFYKDTITCLYSKELIDALTEQWSKEKIKIILDLISFLTNDSMASNNVKTLETIMDNHDPNSHIIISNM